MEDKLTTFEDFLSNFNLPEKISREEFSNRLKILSKNENFFSDYIQKISIKDPHDFRIVNYTKIIDNLYEMLVTNREETLLVWYNDHLKIDNINRFTKFQIDSNKLDGDVISGHKNNKLTKLYKNINFSEIYSTRKLDNKYNIDLLSVLKYMFEDYTLRDTLLIPMGSRLIITKNIGGLFAILRGTCVKASIFNPYTYGWVLDNILKGKKLFTPVLAWNAYQIGFNNSSYKEMVGTDVIPSVVNNSEFFKAKNKKYDFYCCPSEKLDERYNFIEKYENYFDTVFFSPPYYILELYNSTEQSVDSFPDYQEWLKGYWEETVKLCLKTMKEGAKFAFVISDFKDGNTTYNISEDMLSVAKKYFSEYKNYKIAWNGFKNSDSKMKDGNYENLFILTKGEVEIKQYTPLF